MHAAPSPTNVHVHVNMVAFKTCTYTILPLGYQNNRKYLSVLLIVLFVCVCYMQPVCSYMHVICLLPSALHVLSPSLRMYYGRLPQRSIEWNEVFSCRWLHGRSSLRKTKRTQNYSLSISIQSTWFIEICCSEFSTTMNYKCIRVCISNGQLSTWHSWQTLVDKLFCDLKKDINKFRFHFSCQLAVGCLLSTSYIDTAVLIVVFFLCLHNKIREINQSGRNNCCLWQILFSNT